jgi:hypothetical protein
MDEPQPSAPGEVGGTTWERATAQQELITARQSGDVEAEAIAYTRYLDGAINASIGMAAQVMEQAAKGIRDDFRAENKFLLEAVEEKVQHENNELYERVRRNTERRDLWYEQEIKRWNEQVKHFSGELNAFPDVIRGAVAQVLTEVRSLRADVDMRVGALEEDFGTFRLEQTVFNAQSSADRADLRGLINQLPQSEQLKVIKEVQHQVNQLRRLVWGLIFAALGSALIILLLFLIARASR